jgi:hypothetical protein
MSDERPASALQTLELFANAQTEDFSAAPCRFRIEYSPVGPTVRFKAFQVLYETPDGAAYFEHRDGCGADGRETRDTAEARPLVSGSVRENGSAHLYVGDEDGHIRFGSAYEVASLGALLEHVHERCGRMMADHADLSGFRSAY